MRFSVLISLLRPIGPVIIGISLGFTLSLLSVSWVEESCDVNAIGDEGIVSSQDGSLKGARRPNSISPGNDGEVDEEEEEVDFQPRIIPYKPVVQTQPKKLFR